VRLNDLVKDGKIYLSLSDALALALENNYDIAIARYDLDIADTDILRAKSGNELLGAPSGLVTNTLGGSSSTLTSGGGPGGTSVGSGGAGSGTSGLSLDHQRRGSAAGSFRPDVTARYNSTTKARRRPTSLRVARRKPTLTTSRYSQGFATGTSFQFVFDNTYATNTNGFANYSPQLNASFKATVTQHVLQGAGIFVNKRFIYRQSTTGGLPIPLSASSCSTP
jgi:outer membrane protein